MVCLVAPWRCLVGWNHCDQLFSSAPVNLVPIITHLVLFLPFCPLRLFSCLQLFLRDIFLSRNDYISEIYISFEYRQSWFPFLNKDCRLSPPSGMEVYFLFITRQWSLLCVHVNYSFHYSYITVITFCCIALQMVPVWLGLGSKTTWLGSGKDRTLVCGGKVQYPSDLPQTFLVPYTTAEGGTSTSDAGGVSRDTDGIAVSEALGVKRVGSRFGSQLFGRKTDDVK